MQPSGVVMPIDSMNGEIQLFTLFASRGEPIDYRVDATSTPGVFSPRCDFSATLVLSETGTRFAVGWYNTDGATTLPGPADINVVVRVGTPVGAAITGAEIRSDPAYAGGLIGFALVGGQTHFSEARLGPSCTTCASPGPWVTSVIYASSVARHAYYVAFEDGTATDSPTGFGGDGDYNDYVYFFDGLTCAGGGGLCDTGQPGVCAAGSLECAATGMRCVPERSPGAETCNGLDDDCNEAVDDGTGLCGASEVCDRGSCIARCSAGGCAAGFDCSAGSGLCVEAACVALVCPSGEACRVGVCAAPCGGVVCPGDLVCRVGRCIDPCAGVTCPAEHACAGGECVPPCACSGCGPGLACTASGRCEAASCVGVDCTSMPGALCRAGVCVDACAGVRCPRGEECRAGACVDGMPDAGSADADAGGGGLDAGSAGADAGGRSDAGGADAETGRMDAGSSGAVADSGCGCRAGATGASSPARALTVAAFLAILARGRTRRRRRACRARTARG